MLWWLSSPRAIHGKLFASLGTRASLLGASSPCNTRALRSTQGQTGRPEIGPRWFLPSMAQAAVGTVGGSIVNKYYNKSSQGAVRHCTDPQWVKSLTRGWTRHGAGQAGGQWSPVTGRLPVSRPDARLRAVGAESCPGQGRAAPHHDVQHVREEPQL